MVGKILKPIELLVVKMMRAYDRLDQGKPQFCVVLGIVLIASFLTIVGEILGHYGFNVFAYLWIVFCIIIRGWFLYFLKPKYPDVGKK